MCIKYFHSMFRLCALAACLVALGGCASKQAYVPDSRDSLEGFNRTLFQVHQSADFFAIKPVANAYGNLLPGLFIGRISSFFANMDDVSNAVNNLLQGQAGASVNDLLRFVINSTIGILGLFDVASALGLEKHDQDFGRTLAAWGIGPGSYWLSLSLGRARSGVCQRTSSIIS